MLKRWLDETSIYYKSDNDQGRMKFYNIWMKWIGKKKYLIMFWTAFVGKFKYI